MTSRLHGRLLGRPGVPRHPLVYDALFASVEDQQLVADITNYWYNRPTTNELTNNEDAMTTPHRTLQMALDALDAITDDVDGIG